jgi:Ca2+:H+ antiporter
MHPILFLAVPPPQDLTFARLSGIGGQPERARLGLRRVTRRLLFASLGLAPLVIGLGYLADLPDTLEFVLSALALIPLAWLIGEATEHAAEHTGPGIGGFLNATFGNAPELIIALLAVNDGLTEVVRGSLTGSVVSNLLLVLGLALVAGDRGKVDRRSTFLSLGLLGFATLLFLVPAIPGWHGDPNRDSLNGPSVPIAVVLLAVYVGVTWHSLRRHRALHEPNETLDAWSLRSSLVALAAATIATALVAELLVHSLEAFADKLGLSDFFVAAVIVAIVGNAAEHGGAVLVAHRGKIALAAEIAVSSATQVAVFLVPAVVLLSWLIEPLALSFRVVELGTLWFSIVLVGAVVFDGRSTRTRGSVLVVGYAGVVVAFLIAGSR